MGKRLHILPASTLPHGGGTAKVKDAWLYWKQDGADILLRIDDDGDVLHHTSGPRDEASSYQDIFIVEEGARIEAAHSIEEKPHTFERMTSQFERFEIKQTLSKTLAGVTQITIRANGELEQVEVLPLATVNMKEAFPIDSKIIMIVPNVPLLNDPAEEDLNSHARKFGEQWRNKDPENRDLVLVRPGDSVANFKSSMIEASGKAQGREIIINVGHGSENSTVRGTAFFDITPRRNNRRGESTEATGAMFTDDLNETVRDPRVVAFEEVGKVFERDDIREFVILACKVGGRGADLFMEDVSFFLRTAVTAYKQKIAYQGLTDENFVMRSATLLEIEGSLTAGLPENDKHFTELPTRFKKTIPRQTVRPNPNAR